MLRKLKLLYKHWINFGRKVASFQIKVVFTLAYFVVIVPFGIIMKIFYSFNNSGWHKVNFEKSALENAKRQF